MNSCCDVILTYSWNRVGYTILKSLYEKGLNVWVADTSKKNICSMSRFCAGSFIYPDPFTQEEEFIKVLVEQVLKLKPRVLLPTHDESVVIMRHRDKFPKDLIIPYEDEEKLLLLANKAESSALAKSVGVPVPEVYTTIDEIKSYPVVFKTVIGNSAKGVFFPKSKEELLQLLEQYKQEKTFIQEFIGGSDYSVDCIRWNGFCKATVYKAIVTKTDGGGTTTQREIVNMPQLELETIKFLDAVDFKGVCGLDFRYDMDQEKIAYIETNARFTGGIATPVVAGFDIPWILYRLATEGKYDEPINVKIGTKTKWILGDIITFVGRLVKFRFKKEELKQIMTFSGFDGYDDFTRGDEKAILGELLYYFNKLVKSGKLNP